MGTLHHSWFCGVRPILWHCCPIKINWKCCSLVSSFKIHRPQNRFVVPLVVIATRPNGKKLLHNSLTTDRPYCIQSTTVQSKQVLKCESFEAHFRLSLQRAQNCLAYVTAISSKSHTLPASPSDHSLDTHQVHNSVSSYVHTRRLKRATLIHMRLSTLVGLPTCITSRLLFQLLVAS